MKHLYCICAIFFMACSGGSREATGDGETLETLLPETQSEVTVATLRLSDFHHELVSNGKLVSARYADLRFESAEPVEWIWVKNGDVVDRGDRLAQLSLFRLKIKTDQARDVLDRAALELQDVLIGQGFSAGDSAAVPAGVMQLARTRSGYENARIQYDLAVFEERNATLVAPFAGTVANLFSKPFNVASTTDVFCSIVGSEGMEASFTVLESELSLIRKGDRVEVSPFFGGADAGAVAGYISEINPIVEANGTVRVRAALASAPKRFFEGMNVRVSVQRTLPAQLVVPKTAVVLRSGKQVVFSLVNGKAYWNYVQTGFENVHYYTVIDGLKEGDEIITGGNINLAHESGVTVIPASGDSL
jgi:RND family efflux transporter MFP subunit